MTEFISEERLAEIHQLANHVPPGEKHQQAIRELLAEIRMTRKKEKRFTVWEPTKWWRAVGPDGELWCESSSENEIRERARPGDRIEQLWASRASQWRNTTWKRKISHIGEDK